MKVVVIDDTGLIGAKTVAILRKSGQEVVATPLRAKGSRRPWPAHKW